MKQMCAVFLVLVLSGCSGGDLVDRIDPFIGTGGHGHTFPGPTLPFGMVQVGPDTRLTGWDGCSGYHFTDDVIYGFSHTHLSGTGVGDYGDILLMPVVGPPLLENGYPDQVDQGYGSRFLKADEHAAAGYYAVHLQDYDIDVELTATTRTGLHRYVFPPDKPAHVIIDLRHRDRLSGSDLQVVDETTIAGYRRSAAWARDQWVYFQARFSQPFVVSEINEQLGVLSFGNEGGPLLVQVAISAVDEQGAQQNLEAEWANFDFAATRQTARSAWQQKMNPYTLDGASVEDQTLFATALYHSFIAPNLFSDVDGRYRGLDQQSHQAEDRNHYTVFSLWDTYRATHPLFTLVERRRTLDFIHTFLAQYEQGGRLPVWELAGNETDCMIGYHSVSVLADAYLKGLDDFNADLALKAMVHSATLDHFGLDAYQRQGFIGADEDGESVSKTLEYSYDDACIARMAAAMGQTDIADTFGQRAQAWRHLLDPETGFFRPRRNGQWLTPYDPRQVDFNHTEANGWQYRFGAPHHMPQHVAALGGDDPFAAALDALFNAESETTGRDQADITGRMGQYAHGNEPSHHMAWLYHFAGLPGHSADRVNQILDTFYTPEPDGLIGNEDCGQMSSWYVLAAFGLYDVAPSSRQWLIIPPRHQRMSVRFEDGQIFTTRRTGTGDVQRVTFNGEPLTRSFLWHEEVIAGGELVFELGDGGTWGQAAEDRPGTPPETDPILPAPWAEAKADRFRGTMNVMLKTDIPNAKILWTDQPHVDPMTGTPYVAPIHLTTTTNLRFVATTDQQTSPVVSARFDAIEHNWKVAVESVPNPQYTAGGPDALLDGRPGAQNWRTGAWQGYQDQDFVATLELGELTRVASVSGRFLQDMRSWIWMPNELRVEVSVDGKTFKPAGRVTHDVPDDVEGIFVREMKVVLDCPSIRAIRFHAVNYGTIPAWHPGAGGEAFIFVDELMVEKVKRR